MATHKTHKHTDKHNTQTQESKTPEKKNDEEIKLSVDTTKIFTFFKTYGFIALLLIPLFLSIFLRMQTNYLPTISTFAEQNVDRTLLTVITQEIDKAYPNLPASNKDILVQQKLTEIKRTGLLPYQGQVVDVNDLIEQNAASVRSQFQDESGQTYLLEIDTYYYYRYYHNLITTGHTGFMQVDGNEWDPYRLAPKGTEASSNVHIYASAFIYNIWQFFDSDVDPIKPFFFVPLIVSTLCVIPAFFIGRKIAGNLAVFIAALILAISPAFLARTVAGFSDTDAYVLLFPLFITWVFLEFMSTQSPTVKYGGAALAGLLIGVFAYAWQGWWYIFDFILAIFVVYIVYLLINVRAWSSGSILHPKLKPVYLSGALFFTVSMISTVLFTSWDFFTNFITDAIGFTKIKAVGVVSLWPNVQTTVAELNEASLSSIVTQSSMGMLLLFFIALVSLVLIFKREVKEEEQLFFTLMFVYFGFLIWTLSKIHPIIFVVLALIPFIYAFYNKYTLATIAGSLGWYAILLKGIGLFEGSVLLFLFFLALPVVVLILQSLKKGEDEQHLIFAVLIMLWFLGTIYASTKGVRFIMLLVPAFSIACGVGIALIIESMTQFIAKKLEWKRIYVHAPFALLMIVLLFVSPIKMAYGLALQELPLMNDTWNAALTKIDQEAAPDAIINSWWDFGHWFITLGKRGVTFDGAGQDRHMAYWMGRALVSNDELKTIGILRMVDCGNNDAFWTLDGYLNDSVRSIDILNEIIVLSRDEAKQVLTQSLSEAQAEDVLKYTHCTPPENYFITSGDMTGKAGVWAHFGSWDFKRSKIANLIQQGNAEDALAFMQESGYSAEDAQTVYAQVQAMNSGQVNNWIAPWPSYASGLTPCTMQADQVICQNGIFVNLTTKEATLQTTQGSQVPSSLVLVLPNGTWEEVKYVQSDALTNLAGRKLSIALIPMNGNYQAVLLDEALVSSTYNRLSYFMGYGMNCFDPFYADTDITGSTIIVWKVDWECTPGMSAIEQTQ